jgi:hypothetical protein
MKLLLSRSREEVEFLTKTIPNFCRFNCVSGFLFLVLFSHKYGCHLDHPLLVSKLMVLEMEKVVGNVYLEVDYDVHHTLCNLNWRKVFGNVN